MQLASRDNLPSSFPTCSHLIPFPCLMALNRISRNALSSSGERQTSLVIDLSGDASSFSPFTLVLASSLLCINSILLMINPSKANFHKVSNMNFIECFLCIYWDTQNAFLFGLLMCCVIFIDLCMLNHLPYKEKNST